MSVSKSAYLSLCSYSMTEGKKGIASLIYHLRQGCTRTDILPWSIKLENRPSYLLHFSINKFFSKKWLSNSSVIAIGAKYSIGFLVHTSFLEFPCKFQVVERKFLNGLSINQTYFRPIFVQKTKIKCFLHFIHIYLKIKANSEIKCLGKMWVLVFVMCIKKQDEKLQ